MMRRKLYGNNINPACGYCAHGVLAEDRVSVLCRKKGIVSCDYKCRRFKYDPLKRIPKIAPELMQFDAEDFALE
ncbi:MAG: hypothetical protein IJN31_08535 [Peptococcaceae bacterium]|nr:hypothetical protein [Clostridia bacterium]MBQ7026638.1 hypothetical protein [Peptococcaceae bacterium]